MKTPPERLRMSGVFRHEDKVRTERLRSDIACRLKKSCIDLPAAEFESLVDKIMKVQIRGESRTR